MNRESIFHGMESGLYEADIPVLTALAAGTTGPTLDVGTGAGRIAIALHKLGHPVVGLDMDQALLDGLKEKEPGIPTVCDDATKLADTVPRGAWLSPQVGYIGGAFGCIIAAQNTVQLMDRDGRREFVKGASEHLRSGGVLAMAVDNFTDEFWEPGEIDDDELPEYEATQVGTRVYETKQAAITRRYAPGGDLSGFTLHWLRLDYEPHGHVRSEWRTEDYDFYTALEAAEDGEAAGMSAGPVIEIPADVDDERPQELLTLVND